MTTKQPLKNKAGQRINAVRVKRPKPSAKKMAKDGWTPEAIAAAEFLHDAPEMMQAFVREYLFDLNATQAAIRAGYSAKTAAQAGARLLRDVKIARAIGAAKAERARVAGLSNNMVLDRLMDISFADPRELCEVQRGACRCCWGTGFLYQRTVGEMERERTHHDAMVDAGKASGDFDERGGAGYTPKKEPNVDCPECFGDGSERVVFKDTSRLSRQGAALFAGVKTTKDGLEIKMHDQPATLMQLGRHLGLFDDKLRVTGKIDHDVVGELRKFIQERGGSRLPIGGPA